MDGNKDEAEKCLEYAESYIRESQLDKAEKFLLKAQRLYPTDRAKELLAQVEKMNASAAPPPSSPKPNDKPNLNSTTRRRNLSGKENVKESSEGKDYTKEQLEAVQRIKRCKDYYEILGVTKEATDSELKKAYKKLALQLHPDKNKVPGAAEAFKAIGSAVAVLTDAEKRKQYDMYGSEHERINTHHHSGYEYNYSRGFEADVTAEELFNMFFGGGFPGQNVYVRRRGRWERANGHAETVHQREANGYTVFVQMLPILLLILLSMMGSFFMSDPIYSLHQSHKYSVGRKTMNLKVPYFVKESFHTDYQGSLRRLEISVEEEYVTSLRHSCHREKNYKETMLWKARNFGEAKLYQQAQQIRTPSCETLYQLQTQGA